jgi:hypothetical protein
MKVSSKAVNDHSLGSVVRILNDKVNNFMTSSNVIIRFEVVTYMRKSEILCVKFC